jgi:3'-phosphoadenosine 5'-phosphosulfate sulfotransferase (PAPS reductase)/FAD synthetase
MNQARLKEARQVIADGLTVGKVPVVLSSFGKDSVVLLDLVKEQIPGEVVCLWLRYDFKGQHRRHQFAHDLIIKWGLKVFDYLPALRVPVSDGGGDVELAQFYSCGQGDQYLIVLMGTDGQYGECMLDVGHLQTTPRWDYAWDITFSGQRKEESHPMFGPAILNADGWGCGDTRLFYPLRNWTLSDIWDYTLEKGLPFNAKRYTDGDADYDGDQYSICSKCINPASEHEDGTVFCPKENKPIKYLSEFADWPSVLKEMKEQLNANTGN